MNALGKYEVLEEIGRGSMGIVYLGRDPFKARSVALKVAHKRPESDGGRAPVFQNLFFNEMRAASMLRHPNIVEVYDAGVEGDDLYYIAMEYVSGGETLEAYCHSKRLTIDTVADVIFKCAEALDYAHRKGVIHRDIKPGNIMVGEHGQIKLGDFSVALLTDPNIKDTQLMETVGSPLYMSPEQIREESVTNQSDLFSLGVVLYELLTGQHPFEAHTLASLTHRILNEPPPPVEQFRLDVPDSLKRILDRVLSKNLTDRYQTALELAADLSQTFSEITQPLDGIATEGRVDVLKELSFFKDFPDAEIWELLRWADWEDYSSRDTIIAEGERGDTFYIVVSGEVSVHKGGRELARLGPGQCFGEIAYLATRERTASVMASHDVSTLKMNAQAIERASLSCRAQFQKVFIRTLIERLLHTNERMLMWEARMGRL